MKARSVSVLGGESMDKDGKNGTFREMGKMFGIDLQEKCGTADAHFLPVRLGFFDSFTCAHAFCCSLSWPLDL